ncbi:MAG: sugar phosphate isomerase/epimerase [Acidobacteria bacterium]|nr:sugar phosphate isomerase/epimerase [Acidobacteriota bacterium]MDA1233854.1 sugar phosphate isomerase/epimerase [Acidobacteriota bacterium]
MLNRREFLGVVGLAAVGCSNSTAPEQTSVAPETASKIRFAYSGFPWSENVEEAIAMAAKYGFHGVEPFRNHVMKYVDDPQALKAKFDEAGISMATCSNGGQGMTIDFIDPAQTAQTIDDHFAFARDFLTVFGCKHFKFNMGRRPEEPTTDEQLQTMAATLNELGKRTADIGIRIAPHPHIWSPLERKNEVERMFELTDPEYVSITADTAHLTLGGISPVDIVQHHFDRVAALHFKDTEPKYLGYTGATPTREEHQEVNLYKILGTGGVDFPAIYETLTSRGFDGWVTMDFDPPREWEGTIDEQMSANKEYLEDVLGVQLSA